MLSNFIKFFLDNPLVARLLLILFTGWGLATAPFDFNINLLPRDPVAVDATPDIGENQQIVFAEWIGRSPQDVEDQITYPLTTSLLGIPGVKPSLGPDATALGQIYWYTHEGRDEDGKPTGGWDLHELRSIQDFYVRYGLSSAEGVSEVASIGGFVQEYQVDVDPDKMRVYNISLAMVMKAIRESNLDIGAQTLEINLTEYFVRGLGDAKNLEDIESSMVKTTGDVPITKRSMLFRHGQNYSLQPATCNLQLKTKGRPRVI